MDSFISLLAEEYCKIAGHNHHRYCIVLPSRRAGLFLKKDIEKRVSHPIILPQIFSFEDFIYSFTDFRKPEPFEDLTILWKATQNIEGLSNRTFDDMLDWGQVVINDFNEVDAYLIDAGALFKYLANLRKYEVWGGNEGDKLTEFQRIYLTFYESLESLYQAYTREMHAAGLASPGSAARWLAENIKNASFNKTFEKYEKVIFAGLNALTLAEERIVQFFQEKDKALLFYDADRYYLDDPAQEAGQFLRGSIDPENNKFIGNDLLERQRTIKIIGVPGNVSQVRFLYKYITERMEREGKEWLEKTVIVPTDENLLIPLLQSLPSDLGSVNVTMGLPLAATPVAQLVHSVLRFVGESLPEGIHLPSLTKLLMHPWIRSRLAIENEYTENQLAEWASVGLVRADFELLQEKLLQKCSLNQWLTAPDAEKGYTPQLTLQMLHNLTGWIRDLVKNTIHDDFLYALSLITEGIEHRLNDLPDTIQLKTLQKLFLRLINTTRIPFSGEPLEGLQVMGMLETRALDFETVIFLSASDDILPGTGRSPSFIPFDVRVEKSFGLPVFSHKNAITAYHFYRLLQRCTEAVIFYNNQAGDLGKTGEMSRFLQQIQYEFPEKNAQTSITFEYPSFPLHIEKEELKEFPKTEQVLKRLDEICQSGISASALWTYNQCPYKFYLDYILRLRNRRTDLMESTPMIFGQVVHSTLKAFYPEPPCKITPEVYKNLDRISFLLDESFRQALAGANLKSGHLRLLRNAAERFISRFLEAEKSKIDLNQTIIEIIALEKSFTHNISLSTATHNTKTILIQGIFDRIEISDGTFRILDYKTGRVEPADLRLTEKNLETFPDRAKWEKLFQLMIYKWLYLSANPGMSVDAGIIPLKAGEYTIELASFDGAGNFMDFAENALKSILNPLMDPNTHFTQTTRKEACRFCSYRLLCGRFD